MRGERLVGWEREGNCSWGVTCERINKRGKSWDVRAIAAMSTLIN